MFLTVDEDVIDAVPETTYVVIPYPKPSDLPGKFHFVAYGEKEVTIKELQPWPFQKEFRVGSPESRLRFI